MLKGALRGQGDVILQAERTKDDMLADKGVSGSKI